MEGAELARNKKKEYPISLVIPLGLFVLRIIGRNVADCYWFVLGSIRKHKKR
jgi:hypothetical protein